MLPWSHSFEKSCPFPILFSFPPQFPHHYSTIRSFKSLQYFSLEDLMESLGHLHPHPHVVLGGIQTLSRSVVPWEHTCWSHLDERSNLAFKGARGTPPIQAHQKCFFTVLRILNFPFIFPNPTFKFYGYTTNKMFKLRFFLNTTSWSSSWAGAFIHFCWPKVFRLSLFVSLYLKKSLAGFIIQQTQVELVMQLSLSCLWTAWLP